MELPVLDFSVYELGKANVSVANLEKLSKELRKAFTEVGFVYLKNTGINQDEVCEFICLFTFLLLERSSIGLLFVGCLLFLCSLYLGGKSHACFKEVLLFARRHEEAFQQGKFLM